MHIETYVIEETSNLIHNDADLDEWRRLTQELGLTSQKEITRLDKSPVPFLPMNKRIENILTELCPTTVEIKRYNVTPIPLEVLKLVSLSVNEHYFERIEIMYDETSKDPACIGTVPGWYVDNPSGSKQTQYGSFFTKEECEKYILDNNLASHKPYHYTGQKYLIARWADVKQSWEELGERASKLFCSRKVASIEKDIVEKKAELENVRNEAVLRFS